MLSLDVGVEWQAYNPSLKQKNRHNNPNSKKNCQQISSSWLDSGRCSMVTSAAVTQCGGVWYCLIATDAVLWSSTSCPPTNKCRDDAYKRPHLQRTWAGKNRVHQHFLWLLFLGSIYTSSTQSDVKSPVKAKFRCDLNLLGTCESPSKYIIAETMNVM